MPQDYLDDCDYCDIQEICHACPLPCHSRCQPRQEQLCSQCSNHIMKSQCDCCRCVRCPISIIKRLCQLALKNEGRHNVPRERYSVFEGGRSLDFDATGDYMYKRKPKQYSHSSEESNEKNHRKKERLKRTKFPETESYDNQTDRTRRVKKQSRRTSTDSDTEPIRKMKTARAKFSDSKEKKRGQKKSNADNESIVEVFRYKRGTVEPVALEKQRKKSFKTEDRNKAIENEPIVKIKRERNDKEGRSNRNKPKINNKPLKTKKIKGAKIGQVSSEIESSFDSGDADKAGRNSKDVSKAGQKGKRKEKPSDSENSNKKTNRDRQESTARRLRKKLSSTEIESSLDSGDVSKAGKKGKRREKPSDTENSMKTRSGSQESTGKKVKKIKGANVDQVETNSGNKIRNVTKDLFGSEPEKGTGKRRRGKQSTILTMSISDNFSKKPPKPSVEKDKAKLSHFKYIAANDSKLTRTSLKNQNEKLKIIVKLSPKHLQPTGSAVTIKSSHAKRMLTRTSKSLFRDTRNKAGFSEISSSRSARIFKSLPKNRGIERDRTSVRSCPLSFRKGRKLIDSPTRFDDIDISDLMRIRLEVGDQQRLYLFCKNPDKAQSPQCQKVNSFPCMPTSQSNPAKIECPSLTYNYM